MGWGRTLFLGDIGNRLDIEDTERDIAALKRKIQRRHQSDQSQDKAIQRLEAENEELKLYLTSLVRLLMRKDVLSKEELETMVAVIDAEDGRQDGKSSGAII